MGFYQKADSKKERIEQSYAIEGVYLCNHPDSGYLTEILPLQEFPDYIDYLPAGVIVRKIGVMGYLPKPNKIEAQFIAILPEEYQNFVTKTIQRIITNLTINNYYKVHWICVDVTSCTSQRHIAKSQPKSFDWLLNILQPQGF